MTPPFKYLTCFRTSNPIKVHVCLYNNKIVFFTEVSRIVIVWFLQYFLLLFCRTKNAVIKKFRNAPPQKKRDPHFLFPRTKQQMRPGMIKLFDSIYTNIFKMNVLAVMLNLQLKSFKILNLPFKMNVKNFLT